MDLGWQELVIILVVVMIVFGAGKLPEVAKSLGQGVKEFKSAAEAPEGLAGATGTGNVTAQTAPTVAASVPAAERANDI